MPLPPVPVRVLQPQATQPKAAQRDSSLHRSRKRAYVVVKEEKASLAKEMVALEAELDELRRRVGLPTKQDDAELDTSRRATTELEEQFHSSQLFLLKAQGLVARELTGFPMNPLATFIHLPRDLDERRAALRSMRDTKLRRAEQVAVEWLHYLDHTQPYVSQQVFTSDDDCFHCHRVEITPFANFGSARELFERVKSFHLIWEISVSELHDQLAIREDAAADFDPAIWNSSIVTVAHDVGCLEEINTVFFARFHEARGGSPVGVITFDSVDVDELYPYRPRERTSKRGQVVYVVYEIARPNEPTPLVVLKSCMFTIQLPSEVELPTGVEDKLRANVSRWPETMVKYLRSC